MSVRSHSLPDRLGRRMAGDSSRCRSSCLLAMAMVLSLAATIAQATTIRSGHGGHWYDPARSGEGWVLEILTDDRALLYWFTYDEAGGQRWLTALGRTATDDGGEYLVFADLVLTSGGRFGADFDPDAIERSVVGTARLRFVDCDHGEFSFSAFGQELTIPIERLTRTMATFCESRHGQPGHGISEEAGQSGSWFDPDHNGEGYALQWIAPGRALVTWYSFDHEGRQYWMLGTGELGEDGRLHVPQMHATRGARFGAAFNPDDVERFQWGELSLELGCDVGHAGYASVLAPFGSGALDLMRLTRPRGLGCPWQQPSLGDLYAFSVAPVPVVSGDDGIAVRMHDVTDDGTVYGTDAAGRIHRWQLGQESATLLLNDVPASDHEFPWLKLSADGGTLLRDGMATAMRYRHSSGWTELEGFSDFNAAGRATVMSRNGVRFAGWGSETGSVPWRPWLWDPEAGFLNPAWDGFWFQSWQLVALANDGEVVLGNFAIRSLFPSTVNYHVAPSIAGARPWPLRDAGSAALGRAWTCDASCRIVFGAGQEAPGGRHPNIGQAWYWLADGTHAYLGRLPQHQDYPTRVTFEPRTVSADGSLLIGGFVRAPIDDHRPTMFVWTQRSGLENLLDVDDRLAELAQHWVWLTPMAMSPGGEFVLVHGQARDPDSGEPVPGERSLLLHLVPNADDY